MWHGADPSAMPAGWLDSECRFQWMCLFALTDHCWHLSLLSVQPSHTPHHLCLHFPSLWSQVCWKVNSSKMCLSVQTKWISADWGWDAAEWVHHQNQRQCYLHRPSQVRGCRTRATTTRRNLPLSFQRFNNGEGYYKNITRIHNYTNKKNGKGTKHKTVNSKSWEQQVQITFTQTSWF